MKTARQDVAERERGADGAEMSWDGARGAREGREGAQPVPRPGDVPPMPRRSPETAPETAPDTPPLVRWLGAPRPPASPGVWRQNHVPKPPEDPDRLGDRELVGGAVLAALLGWLVWWLCRNNVLFFEWWIRPLDWVTPPSWGKLPDDWRPGMPTDDLFVARRRAEDVYTVLFAVVLACVTGRLGHWDEVWRRYAPAPARRIVRSVLDRFWWVGRHRRPLLALLAGGVVWTACFNGNWTFWLEPLYAVVPDTWWKPEDTTQYTVTYNLYYLLYTALLAALAAWAGRWRPAWLEFRAELRRRRHGDDAGLSAVPPGGSAPAAPPFEVADLNAVGHPEAAARLAEELREGRMSDLDYARIDRRWQEVRARPTELDRFAEEAAASGAAAFPHPSGSRDLAARTAQHDLLTRQVRIGQAPDEERNPYAYRGEEIALDPAVLGTSLLAVGPPGSGKTGRVIRPVTEAMCLQALTGQAAVVAVGTARSALGPDDAFDVVLHIGDPDGARGPGYHLDPYGGATDTDEAARLLAESLVGGSRVEPREAAAVLVQLIGPYHAAYRQLPGVPELRAMLDGAPAILATLREDLRLAGAFDQERELDARARQTERPDDLGPHLADLLALLDRAGFSGGEGARRGRPFSLADALAHPMRVRVDLPPTGHTEAARIVTRLLLAQFTAAAVTRPDRSRFVCLILDDATSAVTRGTVRGLTQLRPNNAGAVLALRTLDDVPKELRTGLLGAVGCRMAFSGITTWDAEHFARAWGTEWTEDTDVTRTPDRTGGAVKRLVRLVRRVFTGRDTTTESVTVRRVERERWSASELAHRVPPRHAVLSVTRVNGEPGPPVLVRLG
ncbi:ATP-binding protein [Streptomyces sp. 6N223]|uniref:ATP-binding protein n=1 Tax=Streptomyces sp. 6N223 TaxID=3457412 RepID=UPI003FD39E20